MAVEPQSSALPPAQPSYIFRGHASQIHSVRFVHRNTRLLTGDADGWVVCWKLESKRPVAVWRAHDGAILGTAEWGPDKLITHGRDNTLRIWQLRTTDEPNLSIVLPTEASAVPRPKPWLLHSLPVNTLNFCAFSMCFEPPAVDVLHSSNIGLGRPYAPSTGRSDSVLLSVPARDDKKIEVYQFPDEKLISVVSRVDTTDTGMVMALKLVLVQKSNKVIVIAGYEGGYTAVHLVDYSSQQSLHATSKSLPEFAQLIYLSQPHSQPILSLDTTPDAKTYFTSSADATIAAHHIPELPLNIEDEEYAGPTRERDTPTTSTTASSQVPEPVATDDPAQDPAEPINFSKTSILPTSTTTSSLSFSRQPVSALSSRTSKTTPEPGGLASLLASAPPQAKCKTIPLPTIIAVQPPQKTVQTKHAGQQSLKVRLDGRLLVTAGWDSRVRIYSTKTLKEMAVLKWHKEGVYAVDFGGMFDTTTSNDGLTDEVRGVTVGADPEQNAVPRETGLGRLQRQREEQVQLKHWVAAGAKDGKISLWEVF